MLSPMHLLCPLPIPAACQTLAPHPPCTGLLHVSGPGAGAAPGTGGLAGARSSFPAVRKALRLSVNDDTQMDNPTDVSYLYKGYAPISIRLVESALTSTWAPLGPGAGAGGRAEGPNCLPGPQFDLEQVRGLGAHRGSS